MTVSQDDSALETEFPSSDIALIEQVVRDRDSLTYENIRYIVGSYFRARTFHFLYSFSRNEFKMGKEYKRFLIQPLSFVSILMIPWVVVDVIDSLLFRTIYLGYCPECKWKYDGRTVRHDLEECAYNEEYTALINEILTGHIAVTEGNFQNQAMAKIKEGRRSAYFDLCARKNKYEGALDVACVWFSCGLMAYSLVVVLFPLIMQLVVFISSYERAEIN